MAFDNFGPEDNKQLFNQKTANQWLRATFPTSGSKTIEYARKSDGVYVTASFPSTHVMSGTAQEVAGPLAYDHLHMLISQNDFHAVASSDPALTASASYQFYPAGTPFFHIPRSGSTEYLSVVNSDGSSVSCWVSVVEF